MEIFSLKNQFEVMNQYIDLHGIHLQEAIEIIRKRLNQIKDGLKKGEIEPNIDAKNHVLKIVCGRGVHSAGRPVLKIKVPDFCVSFSLID